MVTIRVLQSIGPRYAQDWIGRFGFERAKHPAYLPMALGAGSVTPMQMAAAYAVFANGGYRVSPALVTRITDHKGQVLVETPPAVRDETTRAIPERNAFVDELAAAERGAQRHRRQGLAGAEARRPVRQDRHHQRLDRHLVRGLPASTRVGVAWIGYDTPRQLGVRGETGGSLSLPIWTGYMQAALQGVPVAPVPVPAGVVQAEGEWYYDDYAPGRGIASLGVEASAVAPAETLAGVPVAAVPAPEERSSILDLFR